MAFSKQSRKRKIEDECRVSNTAWNKKFFLTDVGDEVVYLICCETLSVFKEYNVKRQFETKYKAFGFNSSNQERRNKAATLVLRNNKISSRKVHLYKGT